MWHVKKMNDFLKNSRTVTLGKDLMAFFVGYFWILHFAKGLSWRRKFNHNVSFLRLWLLNDEFWKALFYFKLNLLWKVCR